MNQVTATVQNIDTTLNSVFNNIVSNPVTESITLLTLIMLVAMIVTQFSQSVLSKCKNKWFQFAVFLFFLWSYNHDFMWSVIGATVVVSVLYLIPSLEAFGGWTEPVNSVIPGCLGITKADLLSVFNGDEGLLRKTLYNLGAPLNLPLNDDYAPIIATYLCNGGINVNASCTVPGPEVGSPVGVNEIRSTY